MGLSSFQSWPNLQLLVRQFVSPDVQNKRKQSTVKEFKCDELWTSPAHQDSVRNGVTLLMYQQCTAAIPENREFKKWKLSFFHRK